MIIVVVTLFIAALLIYFSCEFFVNGIEWIAYHFDVAKNATGTILAAFGTALPESIVTFVAVVFSNKPEQQNIGIGAAIGGPLVLATIAYAVVGLSFIAHHKTPEKKILSNEEGQNLSHNQIWFLRIFVCKIMLGLVTFLYKPWLGIGFLLAYIAYVIQEMRRKDSLHTIEQLEPLKIRPHEKNPSSGWALLQTLLALSVTFFSSRLFVHQLETLGPVLNLSSQTIALLFSPVATELPEVMNAMIWARQGKHILSLANISGSMMIQATIPSALGIFFTPWLLNATAIWAALVTMTSIFGLYCLLRRDSLDGRKLSYFGFFYVAFAMGLYFL